MNVIGYTRCSTREQADSGLGLEAQRRAIASEAERRGWQVTWIEDAGYTARNLNRPALQDALRLLQRREASALVVAKLDRLSRSLIDFGRTLETAKRQRWAVVALDLGVDMTTPNGKLVASILAAVAEWESEIIGERVSGAMAEAKVRGAHLGRPATLNPGVAARICAERAAGSSYAAIAAGLNADEVPTPRGGVEWRKSGVAAICARCSREESLDGVR